MRFLASLLFLISLAFPAQAQIESPIVSPIQETVRAQDAPFVSNPHLVLDFNFAADGNLVGRRGPVLAISRLGGGRYFDNQGVMQTSTSNEARFDHNPATLESLGLLVEAARTNLLLQSEVYQTTWETTGSNTGTSNTTEAPDGNTTGDTLTATAGGGGHNIFQQITLAANTDAAFSVYVQAGTHDFVAVSYQTSGEDHIAAVCDLSAGAGSATETDVGTTSGTILSTSITDARNGWFRCTLVGQTAEADGFVVMGFAEAATGNTFTNVGQVTFNAAGTETIVLWGMDAEVGAAPTSYIKTTTLPVSRNVDVVTTTDLSWLNADAGTLFVRGSIPFVSAAERTLVSIDDGGATDRLRLYLDAAENINFETVNSGDTNGASDGAATIAVNTVFRATGTHVDDNVVGVVDGTASTADTSAGIPVTDAATTFRVGNDSAGTPLNGHIAEIQFYNTNQPTAFSQNLTQ